MTDVTNKTVAVAALLELYDEEFVKAAYEAILGRMVDPGGLDNYVGQLRTGTSKEQIIAELAQSPEGSLRSIELPGLRETIRTYRKGVGSWVRIVHALTGLASMPRQLRVIDNRMYLLQSNLERQSAILSELLTLTKRGAGAASDTVSADQGMPADVRLESSLPPWLSRTFSALKFAIATRLNP
jgi:hypothetical protein